MNLVEECSGVGRVVVNDRAFDRISYRVNRFQAMLPSGLPIPGRHRIEGKIAVDTLPDPAELVGAPLVLHLEDGRSLRLTLADDAGHVLAEGHGLKHGCSCC
jgi:hypothetical protein